MIPVSEQFYSAMQSRTNFLEYAVVTLTDGTVFNLTPADFTVTNNSVVDAAGNTVLPLGIAIEKTIQLEIANPDEKYNRYKFYGATVQLSLSFDLGTETEIVNKGTYTVIQPAQYGDSVIITAADDMYKADKAVTGTITFPITCGNLLSAICTAIGISLKSSTFTNSTYSISRFSGDYTNYTWRQLIGYIAQIAGGNARINIDNQLEIISYNSSLLSVMQGAISSDVDIVRSKFPLTISFNEDPQYFEDMSIILINANNTIVKHWTWDTLQTYISENTITLPSDTTIESITAIPCILEVKWLSEFDGTWHTYRILLPELDPDIRTIEILDKWQTVTLETEDITITGVKTTLSAEQLADSSSAESVDYIIGTNEYVLAVSNPFFNYQNVDTLLGAINTVVSGCKMRPFTGTHISNPIIEFMDPVYVVNKRGQLFASIITDINYTILGYTDIKNSAEPKLDSESVFSSESSVHYLKAVESAKKKERLIQNHFWYDSSGVYITEAEHAVSNGYSHKLTSNGAFILYDGVMLTKWTDEGVVFYQDDGTTKTAEYTAAGVDLYANGTKALELKTTGILFNSNLPFTVGNNTSYIKWIYDTTAQQWKIRIAADSIELGGTDIETLAGNKWYTGTVMTYTDSTARKYTNSGISFAAVGDLYLNTDTSNVYKCTVEGTPSEAYWVYNTNIQGDDGIDVTSQYMEFTSANGLRIYGGNKSYSAYTKGFTQIKSTGTSIYSEVNGVATELASFTGSEISLGKNSSSSVIKFCEDRASISYQNTYGTLWVATEGDDETTVSLGLVARHKTTYTEVVLTADATDGTSTLSTDVTYFELEDGDLYLNGRTIGQGNIVAAGDIKGSSFTLNGTTITSWPGGISGLVANRLIYASSQTALGSLDAGTSGYLLKSNGSSTSPSWTNPSNLTVGNATKASQDSSGKTLYGQLTTRTGTGTAQSGFTLTSGGYYQEGKRVYIQIYGTITISANSTLSIITGLPIPATSKVALAVDIDFKATATVARVNDEGKLNIRTSSAVSNKEIVIMGTYLAS